MKAFVYQKEKRHTQIGIMPEKGGSLGSGGSRIYRDMAGAVYLSKKMEDYFE